MDIGVLIGIFAGLIFVFLVIRAFIKAKRNVHERQPERKLDSAHREMFEQMDEDVKSAG